MVYNDWVNNNENTKKHAKRSQKSDVRHLTCFLKKLSNKYGIWYNKDILMSYQGEAYENKKYYKNNLNSNNSTNST